MFSKKIKKVIHIEGMHCNHCAMKVKEVLTSIEGVTQVKVNLDKKEAILTSTQDIPNNLIKDSISNLDFEVTEII